MERDETGFAMVVVLVLITVSTLLAATLLSQGEHVDRSTFRDRKWHTALQVAEAGVQRTIVELKNDFAFGGITATTHVPGGDFKTKVEQDFSFGPGRRTITSTAFVPNLGHPNEVRRRIKVTIGPPPALLYALFAEKCLEVKNNGDPIRGDVFANLDVTLSLNTVVQGTVESSRGAIDMKNGSRIAKNGPKGGSALSGGKPNAECGSTGQWGVNMDNGSVVERNVTSRRDCTSPTAPSPALEYGIKGASTVGGARIEGNAVAWGSIGPKVLGTSRFYPDADSCVSRPATETPLVPFKAKDALPSMYSFYQDAFSGTGVTVHPVWADATAFQTWANANAASMTGVHLIELGSDATKIINLNDKTIRGTFILVSPTVIRRSNAGGPDSDTSAFYNGPSFSGVEGIVQLISLRPDAATLGIDFPDNNLPIEPSSSRPCMLFYTTGRVEMNNVATIYGAIYGSKVDLRNGLKVVYNKCIESSLGFGDAKAVPQVFREVSPSS